VFTKAFWRAAGERAVKTFLQAFVASPVGAVLLAIVANPTSLTWQLLQQLPLLLLFGLVAGLIAAGVSVITSLINARNDGNPSAGNQEVLNATP